MNQLYLHLPALEDQIWELSEVKNPAGPIYQPRVSDHYPGILLLISDDSAAPYNFRHRRQIDVY